MSTFKWTACVAAGALVGAVATKPIGNAADAKHHV